MPKGFTAMRNVDQQIVNQTASVDPDDSFVIIDDALYRELSGDEPYGGPLFDDTGENEE
jgi:hypothetical protein